MSATGKDGAKPPKSEAPKKLRCLVIQMTRLGDTLQSLMALRAAKQLYPGLEIHFVARERFAEAANRIPWIESVIPFPSEKILGPVLSGSGTQAQALRDLARWLSPLVAQPWDFVVNWSYSESSSYLTGILPGRVKLGFSRAPGAPGLPHADGTTLVSPDGWSHYIQAVIQNGIRQNIHLTDILTTQLLTALQVHAGEPADAGDAPVTSKSFFHLSMDPSSELAMGSRWRDPTRKWVALQLGADGQERSWDPRHWAVLARKILKNHPEYGIVLMGEREDAPREAAFLKALQEGPDAQSTQNVISLVGKSDFDLWASVVSRCQWVFSCDTAAVHLASVLGTRVLNLAIGAERVSETGPYGNGHYVLSAQDECPGCQAARREQPPAGHRCRAALKPEIVYGTWSYAIHDSSLRRSLSLEQHLQRLSVQMDPEAHVQVFRSRIRGTSDGGGVVYESLFHDPLSLSEWTSLVMGHVARAWYCGWVPPVGSELPRARITPSLIQRLRELEESAQLLAKICDEANRTALILNRRSARLPSNKVMRLGDREELRDLGTRLMELDLLIARLGKAHEPLQAFAQMCKVLLHNIQGERLTDLGKESAHCYRQLNEGLNILRDWLKHTLKLARPVAVTSGKKATISVVEQL